MPVTKRISEKYLISRKLAESSISVRFIDHGHFFSTRCPFKNILKTYFQSGEIFTYQIVVNSRLSNLSSPTQAAFTISSSTQPVQQNNIMTTIENSAKYGYIITTTPGLLSEGSCPVNRDGDPAKFENAVDYASIVPIYGTRAVAEAAMMAMTPEGATPSTWAGYRVEMAYYAAPLHLAHGMVIGMGGFALA